MTFRKLAPVAVGTEEIRQSDFSDPIRHHTLDLRVERDLLQNDAEDWDPLLQKRQATFHKSSKKCFKILIRRIEHLGETGMEHVQEKIVDDHFGDSQHQIL